jgi:uncharacterized membrane protein YbhN (UPF0104 family)
MKKIIFYIIFFIVLALFITRSDFDLKVLLTLSPIDALKLFFFILISNYVTYLAVLIQFRMLGVKDKKTDVFLLSMATNLLNYFPAKAGVVSLGTYLKTRRGIPINRFVFITMFFYGIVTAVTVLLSFLFLFDEKMFDVYSRINFTLFFISGLFLLFCSFGLYLYAKRKPDNVIMRYYILFLKNRRIISKNKVNIFFVSLIVIAGITLYSFRMYVAFAVSGLEITFYQAFMIGVVANLSFFLSLTPGGLGVKESFVGGVSYLLFGNAAVGIVASLIDRAANLIVSLIAGIPAIKLLDKKKILKK